LSFDRAQLILQVGDVPPFPPPPWLPLGGGGEVATGCMEGISRKGTISAISPVATSVPPTIFLRFRDTGFMPGRTTVSASRLGNLDKYQ